MRIAPARAVVVSVGLLFGMSTVVHAESTSQTASVLIIIPERPDLARPSADASAASSDDVTLPHPSAAIPSVEPRLAADSNTLHPALDASPPEEVTTIQLLSPTALRYTRTIRE